MKKLLLVAAILCSNSSNIPSTYGAQNCSDFRPTSKACYEMQHGGAEGLCKRTRFFLFQQVCSFYCSERGQLKEENCHICNDNDKIYPNCYDLMCERVNSEHDSSTTPKYTTPESSHYFENTTTTSTTPKKDESDEDEYYYYYDDDYDRTGKNRYQTENFQPR